MVVLLQLQTQATLDCCSVWTNATYLSAVYLEGACIGAQCVSGGLS